ncbi:MAG: cysteine--tRNA ligase [Firmicutes bacterium]|nr:cysteine--tRNA ligase [Bacillota bacterium]
MQLYNTLTRAKDTFEPLQPGQVGMYTCGPTVYGYASIGNMRAYIFADTLRRMLEFNGLKVKMVMNITDVGHLVSDEDEGEDKMLVTARREQKSPWEIAAYYADVFFKDGEKLCIKRPTVVAWATKHIAEMIAMVEELLERGYAYETSDGIYFDISKYPEYGRLSGLKLEEQKAGARVEVNVEKRHPADFALWKKAPKEHIMQWPSPWGMGYPGWHIECSAMGRKYLGDLFDIHTGGADHIPVHHENEIAQTAACTGEPPARFWLHNEFLLVDGGKMSKSLGNVYTISDLEERGFEPLSYRYFCHNAHYRRQLNFTWSALEAAQKGLLSLRRSVQQSAKQSAPAAAAAKAAEYRQAFLAAINDDLNLPRAIAIVWEASRDELGNEFFALAQEWDQVLGLNLASGAIEEDRSLTEEELPDEVLALVKKRAAARAAKNWAESDALRQQLQEMGYMVQDTAQGTVIKRV